MASRKIHGAKRAVKLVKKADRVSNFCNDVIGDIAGILSGAAIAGIAIKMARYDYSILNISLIAVVLSGLTASLTVGGKAFGKQIAIRKWEKIVFYVALTLYLIEEKIKIKVMK
jgi:CBS domain containing-hemolysin-like protein